MYHQILHIGEASIPAVIEYSDDESGVFIIDKITLACGTIVPVGVFEQDAIEDMTDRLAKGHDRAVAELDSEYRADRAQERDAFRDAYGE